MLRRCLARDVDEYLRSSNDSKIIFDDNLSGIRVWLTSLLREHFLLQAKSVWVKRWLDDLTFRSVKIEKERFIKIKAGLWWGFVNDIGGKQWRDPVIFYVRLTKKQPAKVDYKICYGKRSERVLFATPHSV